ncbi:hypothetical protein [Actinomadura sp. WMMB 499]|uniref:hypothetical protein n=1 Tax=Actinomadura sp. WMMB 499 TaxID=1219491 RepID=UPI0012492939|nr:hypothetical protein [Actinomadura sp. WMMB 499]QFG23138.1 hypothetical protein F7P10_20435 [Actinomadura sp. WMMB 499]
MEDTDLKAGDGAGRAHARPGDGQAFHFGPPKSDAGVRPLPIPAIVLPEAGLPAPPAAGSGCVQFHDLRHTGNTLAAIAGATLPELKERMGQASDRAAVICLHATDERHREIADSLSAMAKAELKKTKKRSGTQRARKRKKRD